MAFTDETREELLRVEKNSRGEYLVVAKIKNSKTGSVFGDIRQFYTAESGEVLPTKKGCRFNAECAADVVKAMLSLLEVDELEDVGNVIAKMLGDEDDEEDEELVDPEEDDFMGE